MVLLIMQEWIDEAHVDLVLVEVDLVNNWSQHGKIVEQTIFYKHFDKHGIIDNARVNWWSAFGLSACWSGLSEQMIFYKHFHKSLIMQEWIDEVHVDLVLVEVNIENSLSKWYFVNFLINMVLLIIQE
jgi:hypothetical protein